MKKVLLVAGGTGGHIFPALALGQWLQREKAEDIHVVYACGSRPLELEMYRQSGVEPIVLPIEGSPFGIKKIKTISRRSLGICKAIGESMALMKKMRPDFCLLFGGYVSFAPLIAALLCRVPVAVHEQNTIAGKVTRIAHKLHLPIFSGWQECEPFQADSFYYAGIPIRNFQKVDRREAWSKLDVGIDIPEGPIVGVLSGSLTSSPLFQVICELSVKSEFRHVSFLIVGGKGICPNSNNMIAVERQWDMSIIYSVVDIVIARAGASTLAELLTCAIPSLIVPWRGAADGHQLSNARLFKKLTGNYVWDESSPAQVLKQNLVQCLSQERDESAKGEALVPWQNQSCELIWKTLISLVRRESL
ncbi:MULTISPECIES: UDP-N-acetylglucosamine--N-acetylmuramyl-(pentapeptide) pyrophosphoryl-undecaprenol N-acetylglucosamine transferase [Aminobacterium]|uniref:UDP-N-acetylglucosamine--N-acetylmuramyl- (pentapeptide) pyrophosphoryl-undecaprenol N-acetylglucosamine transferase n=1 Tax=Aminobacterium TaxID=81466 RepID=UPI00257FDF19|nr:UDP-N-acetylglucosamine--N-acetylmuramyl-(pentapeptide) pyrophosphoryl-undecaprenol N-acetylglucosamine transferase [Aminobacterium sp. UBA4834]